MEVKGVNWHLGPNRPQIELVPSDNDGIFVVREGERTLVGKVALLSGISSLEARFVEHGDRFPLSHYLIASDESPGFYNLEEGTHVTMRIGEHTVARAAGMLGEFSPTDMSHSYVILDSNR